LKKQATNNVLELNEWQDLIPDPHTKGRYTQFQQTLYLFWIMKNLLEKALTSTFAGIWELATKILEIHKEF